MEGRQQGEASLCVHSKSSMKAEADWRSLLPVEQVAKKGLTILLDMILDTTRRDATT